MALICKDPECGLYHNEMAGTHIYEDCGQTLAEQFPDHYFHCPWWAALLLDLTSGLHGWASWLCARWDRRK